METHRKKPTQRLKEIIGLTILLLSLAACRETESFSESQAQESQVRIVSEDQPEVVPIPGKGIVYGEHLRFDSYSVEDGLSQSTVFCILQDSLGYIWFGTEDGLNKFDGYSFTVYKHNPEDPNSLSSNWISTMLEDGSGGLWFGTRDGGLNRYTRDSNQFTNFRYDPEDPAGLSDNQITALYEDQDGKIWIGTDSGGLDLLDPTTGRFTHFQHEPDNPRSIGDDSILSIHQSEDGVLWVGTSEGGLSRFDRGAGTFTTYKNHLDDDQSISSNSIRAIFEDSSGSLWIGTSAGLDLLDRTEETFNHFQNNPGDPTSLADDTVQAIFEDSSGSLWIGTYGGGLDFFDQKTESFRHYQNIPGDPDSVSSNIILSIFQDREGVLWFGTIGGGVNRLNLARVNFTHYKNEPGNANSLSNNMVRGFYQDEDGTIWVGTMFGGLNRFDPKTQNWQHYRNDPNDPLSLSDDFVSAIYRDQFGILWIGTIHGLDRFEPETESFTHFNVDPEGESFSSGIEVASIHESRDGKFWVGTTDGLYEFDRQGQRWSQKYDFKLGDNQELYVFIITEDQEGLLWIGSLGEGVYRFNPVTGEFSNFQNIPGNDQSLSQNFVTAMLIDQAGLVWVGTNGAGLDMFNPSTNTFTHYNENGGLPNDAVYCLLGDRSGNIWISTNRGLSRFDPAEEEFANYDRTDGLQSNEFNAKACLNSISGEMLFGGINGFNVFKPGSVQSNPVIPPIVITSISKNNEQINLDWEEDGFSEIALNWPVDSFEFEYAALSFAQPEKNQYAYYLDGFEGTWKAVGNRRFGQYTNLSGGTYTFQVKGSNNDGVWNDVGVAVQITVVPPFWQTWWFYGIVMIAILGLFYGGYRLRVANLETRGRELKLQVEQRTAELMKTQASLKQSEMEFAITEERNRLARDLHDSVTQSIYSLTLLAEAGQRMIKGGDFTQAEENQNRLGEIAQQALQEMRLLVYELRPQVLQTEGLLGALEHRLEAVERRAGITARMQVDLNGELDHPLEEELFHISIESLNNTLKHAKASEVFLSLKMGRDSLILTVKDNGRGFNPELASSQGGMGLLSITERVEKIGGSLNFQSKPGTGTTVSVRVPLNPDLKSSIEDIEEKT